MEARAPVPGAPPLLTPLCNYDHHCPKRSQSQSNKPQVKSDIRHSYVSIKFVTAPFLLKLHIQHFNSEPRSSRPISCRHEKSTVKRRVILNSSSSEPSLLTKTWMYFACLFLTVRQSRKDCTSLLRSQRETRKSSS